MSAYSTNKTEFRDVKLLMLALKEMGFDTVEYHENGADLIDFRGRKTHYVDANGDKANVIIRRQYVGGAANDIGFRRTADGTFEAFLSEYDRGCGYNAAWVGKLSAAYAREGIKQKAAKQGLRYIGTVQKNGKKELQFVKAGK